MLEAKVAAASRDAGGARAFSANNLVSRRVLVTREARSAAHDWTDIQS